MERRYRRLLRPLPVGYRHRWEEDMVAAFMEGARASDPYDEDVPSGRLPLAERLSVVALAVRLRLNGSHATPRGLVWYHVVHGLALIVLLYQALAATVSVASGVQHTIVFTVDAGLGAWPTGRPPYATVPTTLNAILVSLAVACAVVGLLASNHLPGGSHSQGAPVRDPH